MTERTMVQAIHDGLREAMRADDTVVVIGEDVGRLGGVFRVTQGLQEEFGRARVIDTPLSESGIVGSALGMAMMGLKPVVEIQFADFVWPAIDQIVSEVAKYRYRTGGEWTAPMVIRMPYGGGIKGGHFHSQSPESNFVLCPGGEYDRSPCGTGTSAKLACLAADGKLAPGEVWRQESILGSVFEGRYESAVEGITPTITGQAFITAESTLILDPADPFRFGIGTTTESTEEHRG